MALAVTSPVVKSNQSRLNRLAGIRNFMDIGQILSTKEETASQC